MFEKAVNRVPNNKAPGRDAIVGYWVKNLTELHPDLIRLYDEEEQGTAEMPQWLVTSKTILLAKNAETHLAKNYHPIACLNITYKLYTGILNLFIEDHCITTGIIILLWNKQVG